MIELEGKRVLVMGLGVHGGGLGVAKWLVGQGAQVTVTDLKPADALVSSVNALRGLPVHLVLGEHRVEDFLHCDLIVRNPGVPRESLFLQLAREHGIPVEMEMGLFLDRLPMGRKQVIGITGTKGKTTTTLMVGAILSRFNPKTVVAGNLRVSALEWLTRIDAETPVVLELSSWQLEGFVPHRASPHLAAITNISPDHLNRYRDFEDYRQSKAAVFKFQEPDDWLVLNADSEPLRGMAGQVPSQVMWTSRGLSLDQGVMRRGDWIVWREGGSEERVISVGDLKVAGDHNIENALVAIALGRLAGARADQVASALEAFSGPEHRQEFVRQIGGVRYINDTTATAPAATIAAIRALSGNAGEIVLIAGGSDKGLDFGDLAQAIVARVRHVVLLEGTATDRLEQALRLVGDKSIIAGRFGDLAQAVDRARELALPGGTVLLSPGCASFGMFANEFERGDRFKQIVSALGD